MPRKHPNTVRWGGPGASHEDRTKPMPAPTPAHPEGAASTNPRVSQVSGGGGERDEKHSHDDTLRSSKSHSTASASPTTSRDWRANRSRNDRAADMAARKALAKATGEPRSFRRGARSEASSPDAPDAGHGTQVRVTFEGDTGPEAAAAVGEAEQRVRRAIAPFDRELSNVEVYLSDAGGVGSPGLRGCTIQATPHRGETVAVTESAGEMDKAVTSACRELAKRLSNALGRRGLPRLRGEASPRAG